MTQRTTKRIYLNLFLALCATVFIIYLGTVFFLMINQRNFFYHPDTTHPDITKAHAVIKDLREVNYSLPDGRKVFGWFRKPTLKKKVVLYFHGNSYNIEYFAPKLQVWADAGYGVFMPEYQGFSDIKGILSQLSMEQDAKAAVAYLTSKGYEANQIILYGHSMGTYVATYTAMEMAKKNTPVNAVILEAPFTSLKETAQERTHHLIPIDSIMEKEYIYPTIDIIKSVNAPVYIGHGKQDTTIPYALGKKLYETATHPKFFFSSDTADHNTLPQTGFIEAVMSEL